MADGSIRIGKIFGIPVELNWLFIFLILLPFIFSAYLLGLIVLLLFICVLIHELSHSVTAMKNGVKISKIILMPLGGVSVMDETRIDPKVEFNISVVGPITNLFLGGVFGIAVLFTPQGIWTFIFQELFLLNIILGVSNIVPSFPLDGARVLRSYFEKSKDQYAATMATVKVSKYCMALILIGTAALFFIPTSFSIGTLEFYFLISLFTVYFLYLGTNAEKDSATMKKETKGVKISQALSRDYAVIPYNANASALYKIMNQKKEHVILAKTPDDGFSMVDIFNEEGLKNARKVGDVLIQIPNISYNTDIIDAIAKLEANNYRVGAVLKGGKLVGIATGNHIRAFIALHMLKKKNSKLLINSSLSSTQSCL